MYYTPLGNKLQSSMEFAGVWTETLYLHFYTWVILTKFVPCPVRNVFPSIASPKGLDEQPVPLKHCYESCPPGTTRFIWVSIIILVIFTFLLRNQPFLLLWSKYIT